jgi:hypothetical protein
VAELIFFGDKKIQKQGRILLETALLRNASLVEGEDVELFFDPETKYIVIKKKAALVKRS